jgi:uncharacterized delta-60 repeat protein
MAANRTAIFSGLASGGIVKDLLPLPDGRMLVSRDGGNFINGSFTAPNPARTTLCYVLTDGSFSPLGTDLVTGIERPAVNGTINVILRLPDGKILVGGNFTNINGHPTDRVARLHPDGSSDTTFSTGVGATGEVRTLALDSSGRILVGGTFNQFSQVIGKNYLVRLNANGVLDTTFVSRATNSISKIVTLPDGGFIVSGEHQIPDFSYRHVARYDASGTYVTAFGPISRVGSVALNPTGDRLYIASSVAPFLSRVNPMDGTLDSTFALGSSAPTAVVENLSVQPDGRVLVYGNFTAPYNRLARYLPDGTLDPDFTPGTGLNVANTHFPIAYDPAGRIWLGGNFTGYKSIAADRILVLDGDVPPLAWARHPLSQTAKARTTVSFTAEARSNAAVSYQWQRNGLPLTDSTHITGTTSTTLTLIGVTTADEGNYTLSATTTASGTITSEPAEFTFLGSPEILLSPTASTREIGVSSTLNVVARGAGTLSYQWFSGSASSPDTAIPGATSASYTLVNPATTDTAYYSVRVTNSLGSFTTSPVLVTYERRSGSQNPGEHPTFNGGSLTSSARVLSILHLPGTGGTLIGGDLGRAYAKTSTGSFTDFKHLARVLPNGDLDLTWPQPNSVVNLLTKDSSGRILAAGSFSQIATTARPIVARFSDAGVLDTSFAPAFSGTSVSVNALAVDTSGNYLLGGNFNNITGQSGTFPVIRISAAGVHDSTFNTAAYNALFTASARALLPLPDGKILVAPGNGSLKRLNSTGTQDFTFSYTGTPIGIIQTIQAIPESTDFLLGGASGVQRISANGANVFTKSASGSTSSISFSSSSHAFIAGNISVYDGSPTGTFGNVLRINLANGSSDPSFITGTSPNSGFNNEAFSVALDATDRLWVGGRFTKYRGAKLSLTVPNAGNGDPLTGLLAILTASAPPITPPDPGAPAPDSYTAYLIAAGVPANRRGTSDDFDGDGSSNADEFTNSTNPALAGDAKFTLSYTSNSFVRTPGGASIPFTSQAGSIFLFTQPAGTQMRVGPGSFGGPNGTTFQGWAPSDFDSTLGYLPAITTTPLDLTLTANRRLVPVLGYPLTQPLPGYLWRSGGTHLWVGSTAVFPPTGGTGQGTARATDLETVGDEAWVETTVTAPGTLKFNWRLDIASGADATLEAFSGNTRLDVIDRFSAQNFNTVRTFAIPGNGPTPVRFKLTRTLTSTLFAAKGQESAYLANFIYTPTDVFADYLAAAGVALSQRGPGADPDGDGVPNLVEFAFGSSPNSISNLPQIYPSSGRSSGSAIQATAPGTVLDPTQTYYTIQIRTPKNSNGVILTPEASGNLTDFGTGPTQLNAYGPAIDDGQFTIQSYFMTPGTTATPTGSGFCRLRATRD